MTSFAFRRDIITKPIFSWARGVLPTMSDTEREALEAGDVWWDADLFTGNPEWSKLLAVAPAALTAEEAAVAAIDTSGRAVLFAGGTVCIALLGIFVLGMTFLNGLAVACALTVAFTVAAAVTLLPGSRSRTSARSLT